MKTSIGIDIGTYAVKIVEVKQNGKSHEVLRAISVPNTTGVVLPVQESDKEKLVELLKATFKENKLPTQNVHIGLPEALLSTKIISIPPLSDAELASAIGWQAEQYIPIPTEELQLEYQVLYRPSNKNVTDQMRVLLLGASKRTIETYTDIFYQAELDVVSLETQMLALYRLAMLDATLPTSLLVNIGASTTDMLVIHEGELAFVYSHPNGGTVLSRAVERGLALDPMQAEEYKRTYGLDASLLEGKVKETMLPVFRSLVGEMQKAIQYFTASRPGIGIKRVLVSGGTASLPALIPSIAETLQAEIALHSPFVQVPLTNGVQIPQLDAPAYAVAVGLAVNA